MSKRRTLVQIADNESALQIDACGNHIEVKVTEKSGASATARIGYSNAHYASTRIHWWWTAVMKRIQRSRDKT